MTDACLFLNSLFVTPAKAGAHHRRRQFKPTVQEMDSRLRGNDELEEL